MFYSSLPPFFFAQKVAYVLFYLCSSALCYLQPATSPGNHSLILYRGLPQLFFNSCVVLHLMGMPSFTQSCSCIWAFRVVFFFLIFCNCKQWHVCFHIIGDAPLGWIARHEILYSKGKRMYYFVCYCPVFSLRDSTMFHLHQECRSVAVSQSFWQRLGSCSDLCHSDGWEMVPG